MSDYLNETELSRSSESHWAGFVNPQWGIGDNPNGGYLVCIAMRAIAELCPQHPDPLSINVHYLRPGIADAPCEITASCLRSGRTVSTARASLAQDGKARVEVLAAMGDLNNATTDNRILMPQPPVIPSPELCPERSGDQQGIHLPILSRLDVRLHPDEVEAGHAGQAQVSGWIRFQDHHPSDSTALIQFADAFPPSVFGLYGVVGWVPTLELTVHVRRRPAPGWILGQFRTTDLMNGKIIEDGLLWDETGQLVAQSRQLALLMSNEDAS